MFLFHPTIFSLISCFTSDFRSKLCCECKQSSVYVTNEYFELEKRIKSSFHVTHSLISETLAVKREAQRGNENLRWNTVTRQLLGHIFINFFQGMWQCDTCIKHLPKFVMRIIYKSAVVNKKKHKTNWEKATNQRS